MDCDPIIKVGDLWENQRTNKNGVRLSNEDPAIPCGLVAKSYFNDTFELWKVNSEGEEKVPIKEDSIAW